MFRLSMNEKFMVKKEVPAEIDHIAGGIGQATPSGRSVPPFFPHKTRLFFDLATDSSIKSKYEGYQKRHRLSYKVSHFLHQNNLGFFHDRVPHLPGLLEFQVHPSAFFCVTLAVTQSCVFFFNSGVTCHVRGLTSTDCPIFAHLIKQKWVLIQMRGWL